MTRSAANAYAPFSSSREAEEIRREARQRQLVIDFVEYASDRAEQDRRNRRRRVKDAAVAVLVSILGVAMFLALCIVWGAR